MRMLAFAVLVGVGCRGEQAEQQAPPTPAAPAPPGAPALTPEQDLGRRIFVDERLSAQGDEGCDVCHGPAVGWTGPDPGINAHGGVYEGSIDGRFGNRKPPSSAYGSSSPALHRDASGQFVGGMFWDGRATGEKLGSPLADQAQGPFLNPLEQALPDGAAVARLVCDPGSPYAGELDRVAGAGTCADPARAFDAIARVIAAFEASPAVEAYTSKYDAVQAGRASFTPQEASGLALFSGKGRCATCHTLAQVDGRPPVFTDHTYANLGIPKNPDNPFYRQPPDVNPDGAAWVDRGLGGFLATRPEWASLAAEHDGKFKVPTLRNVDRRPSPDFPKVYGHNGYFRSLAEIVHFYNTRDTLPSCPSGSPGERTTCWPPPEVAANVDRARAGDLGLTPQEEADLVAFLGTLSDGWTPTR
jgi:cytochrome c peroxidase